jgi:hypothetical protein
MKNRNKCFMLFKCNARTKVSYAHMSIPLKFVNRALSKAFAFDKELVIIVEIINDQEFSLLFADRGNSSYAVSLEDEDTPCILIPEAKRDEIISACIGGFVDICQSRDELKPIHKDGIHWILKDAIDKVKAAVPHAELPEKKAPMEAVVGRTEATGVSVVFFSLIVKVSSLNEKYKGGFQQFIEDTTTAGNPWPWECDLWLLDRIAMADGYFENTIFLLEQGGLNCEAPSPDFYLVNVTPLTRSHAQCLTHDDGAIDYVEEDGKLFAKLHQENGE